MSHSIKEKNRPWAAAFFVTAVLVQLIIPVRADECTIGAASGAVTIDGRPLSWKVRNSAGRQALVHVEGDPYDYIGVNVVGDFNVAMGLNEAGVSSGNSSVITGGYISQQYILENFDDVNNIRDYYEYLVNSPGYYEKSCFPHIDANGYAGIFEVNKTDWYLEYDAMDPDRESQGLLGFVVRANEFHERPDGTDDTSITGGRYESGTYNVSGLVGINMLCARTLAQGNDGTNGFEFARYGPGRKLATIPGSAQSFIVVHGVAPGEDPALSTMWVILGQLNYGIAVPTWAGVSDIPLCLSSGDMYDRAKSLYNKANEATTQTSTFPVEAHMFDAVNHTFLPHWRAEGIPSVAEMTRIEHQMANDAYSLLDCLDNRQSDNKAPEVTFNAFPDGLTVDFELIANDSDGTIVGTEWNFGDDQNSTEVSPSHTYAGPGTYLVSCTVTDDDGVSVTNWRYYDVPVNCDIACDDGMVDFCDLAQFSAQWLGTNCGEPSWCEGADFDRNTTVDFVDFAIFANHWLDGVRRL